MSGNDRPAGSQDAGSAGGDEPLAGAEPGKVKQIRGRDIAIRFAFGAAISIVAGLVSIVFNPVVGGLFLAFPAILPASVTLIEQKESTGEAAHDIEGATIGALGLAVFAVVTGAVLRRTTAVAALIAATAAWLATSVVLYLVIESLLRRRRRQSADHGAVVPAPARPGWENHGDGGRQAGADSGELEPVVAPHVARDRPGAGRVGLLPPVLDLGGRHRRRVPHPGADQPGEEG
jgi:hypothetical protein